MTHPTSECFSVVVVIQHPTLQLLLPLAPYLHNVSLTYRTRIVIRWVCICTFQVRYQLCLIALTSSAYPFVFYSASSVAVELSYNTIITEIFTTSSVTTTDCLNITVYATGTTTVKTISDGISVTEQGVIKAYPTDGQNTGIYYDIDIYVEYPGTTGAS